MDNLADGVRRFRTTVFPHRRGFFEKLAQAQSPHTFFLTCADSRIVPSLLTHTNPGELFEERNPGNVVPVYSDQTIDVAASIEYAAAVLNVRHIVVCGHTDCGAMKGLCHPEKLRGLVAVSRWISHSHLVVGQLPADLDEEAKLLRLTELNVVAGLSNLLTHPAVQMRLARGDLDLHGWVYHIGTGEIHAYDAKTGEFRLWPE